MPKEDYDPKRKIVMLTITERCNLDCRYCYEKDKTNRDMDIGIAKEAIEYEFNHSEGFDEIEFDLFGGEPTLQNDFIIELVEWTKEMNFGKPYLFFLQTNGTLVHGDFQAWLIQNKKIVHAGVSLDGTPETHNQNRSNSYDKIDINFFIENYPHQGAIMTVNRNIRNWFFLLYYC